MRVRIPPLLPYKWQTLNQSEIDGGNISKVCIVPLKSKVAKGIARANRVRKLPNVERYTIGFNSRPCYNHIVISCLTLTGTIT